MPKITATLSSSLFAPPPSPAESAILYQARTAAWRHATRFGMTPEDAEDCAADFVLTVLQAQQTTEGRTSPWRQDLPPQDAQRYLSTCSHHFAFHWRRKLVQRRQQERALLPSGDMPGDTLPGSDLAHSSDALRPDGTAPSAGAAKAVNPRAAACSAEEAVLLRLEAADFWHYLFAAIATLPDAQRHAFVRHYLEDETIALIAERSGQTVPSVKQKLYRARLTVGSRLPHAARKIVEDF